jgi:cyclophilin family peptidyl-prolyl cis-trans isomerase
MYAARRPSATTTPEPILSAGEPPDAEILMARSAGRRRALARAGTLALLLAACTGGERRPAPVAVTDSTPTVVLETSLGRIVMRLDRRKAPMTVEHILTHVQAGFYDGLIFHRVIPRFIIQAGLLRTDGSQRGSDAQPVPNEAENGLTNVRGAVGLARPRDPHLGAREFFIDVKDNPALDFKAPTVDGFGYAVFGHVTLGMDVVDRIAALPTARRFGVPNVPVTPVLITRAYVDTTRGSP